MEALSDFVGAHPFLAFHLWILLPAVSVYRLDLSLALGRKGFALGLTVYLISWLAVANMVMEAPLAGAGGVWLIIFGVAVGTVVTYTFYWSVVWRALDAGHGKEIAYVAIVPLLNLVVFFLLLLQPSVPLDNPGEDGDAGV